MVLNLSTGALQTELVHIHSGQCTRDTLGGVVHDLTSFVGGNGASVSMVDVTLASLRTGDFAINTHKAGEPGVYTSCGNIPLGQPDVLAIALGEDHDSGQSGRATLTAVGNKTVVVLDLSEGAMETELVHIHSGSCGDDTLGGVVHGLSSFVGGSGTSVTNLGATLASLRTGEFAINTHKVGDPGVYTSCGNIPPAADTMSISIALNGQDDSGQSGWATLTSRGEQTEVVLNLAAGALQTELVHIHSGQCSRDTLGGVVHDLTSFAGGSGGSVTSIDVTLASLRTGDFAVNTHQAGNPGVYTARGNIPMAAPRVSASVTIGPSKDNTLYEDPDKVVSNGAGQYFFAGQTALGQTRRGLISFDIASSIPAGATIDSVRLSLNMSRTSSGDEPVELRRVLADSSEGTTDADEEEGKGAAAAAGDATWEHRTFDTVTWELPGGDFSSAASASTQVCAKERYTWGSTAEMVADVQGWLDGRSTNFGWILLGNEESGKSSKRFDTKENETGANRPVLTIEYTS